MSEEERMQVESAEAREAVRGLGLVKLRSILMAGKRPVADFFVRYPEARQGWDNAHHTATDARAMAATPTSRMLLSTTGARKQVASNWCGPATMQMIDGNDPKDGAFESQASWANDMGTGPAGGSGTWIGSMVSQVNAKTSWTQYGAGQFIVQSVSDWTLNNYWFTIKLMIGDWGTPYIEHPLLSSTDYPYMKGSYGGHFQMARGYSEANGSRYIHIFEPYNEPDFTSWTANTWGARKTPIAKALHANKVNQGNIGV